MDKHVFSDSDINKGIEDGIFVNSGMLIRNTENGQIVKIINKEELNEVHIPFTLVQINNNYIYQADLRPIIESISNNRQNDIYDELEENYSIVIDSFNAFKTYGREAERVSGLCLKVSNKFDLKIRNEIKGLCIDDIESKNLSKFNSSLSAYVDILFFYIVSTYMSYRDKFSEDTVILGKLESFENNVRSLYEQLLAESWVSTSNDGQASRRINMNNSIYSMYLFDDSYDIRNLERLVRHDSRFSSIFDVFHIYKSSYKTGRFTHEMSNSNQGRNQVAITQSGFRIDQNSKRNSLIESLYLILEAIEHLKNIRNELVGLKGMSDIDLFNKAIPNVSSPK